MASTNEYTRVSKGNVTVLWAQPDETTGDYQPSNLKSIGCIKGDLSIPHTRAEETEDISDWCTVLNEKALEVTETGAMSISASFTLSMVASDEVQHEMLESFKDNEINYLSVKFADNLGANESFFQFVYAVKIQEFTPTGRESGTSDWTVNMLVQEVIEQSGEIDD